MSAEDLSDTIIPKSDQLNSDDLLINPLTVTITNVSRGAKDQPISIAIPPHQPYKPCKSMRRVLISMWGKNGKDWVGKSLTLYCDPDVTWGGVAVGGIRISHASHIDKTQSLMLTATRSKRARFIVQPLETMKETVAPVMPDGLHEAAMDAAGMGSDAFREWYTGMPIDDRAYLKPRMAEYQRTAERNDSTE